MQEETLEEYHGGDYAKTLAASVAKDGKTCFLIGSLLGVLPWQKYGGVVDRPENLHVIAVDMNAVGGVLQFLQKTCGAPDEIKKVHILNLQDDFRKSAEGKTDYDMTFYNVVMTAIMRVKDIVAKRPGVHALLFSSLTGIAEGIERGITGPPGSSAGGKGYADRNKWTLLSSQLHELRNFAQVDEWHCIWEAHIDKVAAEGGGTKETIRVRGEAGRSWGYNVEQVFRIRRNYGSVHPGTKCDNVYCDTRPSGEYVANGRGFTESLNAQEPDMTLAYHKLGKKIGKWGYKPKAK